MGQLDSSGLSNKRSFKTSSPIRIFLFFHKAIRSELDALHRDAMAFATNPHSDIKPLLERYHFLRSIYNHHCNVEDEISLAGTKSRFVIVTVLPRLVDLERRVDELIWGAAWLHKATKLKSYWNYVTNNINNIQFPSNQGNFAEFGWDTKNHGINILVSQFLLNNSLHSSPFLLLADKFVCSLLSESKSPSVTYSPGGLLFKPGMVNLQHTTGLSFLLVVYAGYLKHWNRVIACDNFVATPYRLIHVARGQVDYILGKNPMNMSYMVGYGEKYPERVHHRGASLPSMDEREEGLECKDGTPYLMSNDSNPNAVSYGTKLFFRGQLIWEAIKDELLSVGLSNSKQLLFVIAAHHHPGKLEC